MTLICGIPNAGKTTYSSKYDKVIHYDDIKLIGRERIPYILNEIKSSSDICIDGVFGIKEHRRIIANAMKEKGSKAVCIWLNTPLDICLKREMSYRRRPLELVKIHNKRFVPPDYDEGWDEIIVISETNNG